MLCCTCVDCFVCIVHYCKTDSVGVSSTANNSRMISESEKNSFEIEMDNFDEETLNDYDNSSVRNSLIVHSNHVFTL